MLLDQLVDGGQIRIIVQHFLVHRGNGLLEGNDIRIGKGDALLLFRLVLCLFHSGFPSVPLGLVENLEPFVKDGPFLLAEALHKIQVANEDVGNHLMHGVGIVLTHIPVAVVG